MATITEEKIRVRYGETDKMGHAYYANYLFWFEQARGAWCRDRGYSYLDLENKGIFLPVIEAHVEYKAEVLYDDIITVRVWLGELKRASMRFDYEIVNDRTGVVSTTGFTRHLLMGTQRKAVTMPADVREWLVREPRSADDCE